MTIFTRKSPVTGKENTREIDISQEQADALMAGMASPSQLGLSHDDAVFLLSGATPECVALREKAVAQKRAIAAGQRIGDH